MSRSRTPWEPARAGTRVVSHPTAVTDLHRRKSNRGIDLDMHLNAALAAR